MSDKFEEKNLDFECPICSSKSHQWKEVYYNTGSLLVKAEKQYISWCSVSKQFVLYNNQIKSDQNLEKVF